MPDIPPTMPSSLRANARWERFDHGRIPVMVVHPDWNGNERVPVLIWMHGRTASKELDPGRYLRLMRGGIGVCAIDLPGHGERHDEALQAPDRSLDIVLEMRDDIDLVVADLLRLGRFDDERMAIGGMSAGGMATLLRLCDDHPFAATSLEATSGSWRHQRHRAMFEHVDDAAVEALDPINRLGGWREIPFQAQHARHDEWIDHAGQVAFVEELRRHYDDPDLIELVTYEETGAPYEHIGFGRMASEAKNRQRDFLLRHV